MQRSSLRLPLVLAAIAVLSLPAAASARGGGGGGGGGGVVTPPPTGGSATCAKIVSTKPTQVIKRNGAPTFSYNVTNCSTVSETVQVVQSGLGTFSRPNDLGDYTCTAAPATATTLTISPGSTKGFSTGAPPTTSFSLPGVTGCPLPLTGAWVYTGTAVDPATGAALASADSTVSYDLSF
jgi:hypothetical protein